MSKAVVRPRAKSAAAREAAVSDIDPNFLSTGDTFEFSTTVEVKTPQNRSFWVKGGASSSVRPGEDGYDAVERVTAGVLAVVDEQVAAILS
jgi:hypothetical protein